MAIKLTLFRIISKYYIARITRIATYILLGLSFVYLLIIWLLAYIFSPWWWLLAIPLAIVVIAFIILRTIIMLIARIIYPEKVTTAQATDVKAFIDKLNRLFEIKNINPVVIALVSIKDFALYRELRTLKAIIDDSRTIQTDFKKLNDQF